MTTFDANPYIWLTEKEAGSLASELSISFPDLTASVKNGRDHGSGETSFLVEITCNDASLIMKVYNFADEWNGRSKLA